MLRGRNVLVAIALGMGTVGLRGLLGTARMDRASMRLKSEFDFGFEQGHIAGNLARGDGYSVRFGDSRPMPTAWASPLYPLILAGIFRVWGVYSFDAHNAVIWLNAIFHGLIAGLLYLMGGRIAGDERARGGADEFALPERGMSGEWIGLIAVGLFLFLPSGWQFLHWAWCIHLLGALILLHLWVLSGGWRSATCHAALSGATLGLAMLADGAAVMIVPVSIWHLVMRGERRAIRRMGAFVVAGLIVLSPWAMRNGITTGSYSPLRGMLGTALWMGNHPGAAEEDYHGVHENPWHNAEAAKRFVARGERGFDADCRERFVAELERDPARIAQNCLMRVSGFWFGEWWIGWRAYPGVYAVGLIAMTLMSWSGLIAAWRRGLRVGVCAGVMLLFPLSYYATFLSYGRYRYPIEPVLCLMAAAGIAAWIDRRCRIKSSFE